MKITRTCIGMWLILVSYADAGDTTQFRVDSYVPKYFRDFEWRVDLSAFANGFDSPTKHVFRNGDPTHYYDYDGKSRSIDFSMFNRFRRITVPSFLDFSLKSEVALNYDQAQSLDSLPENAYGERRFSYCETRRPGFSLRLSPVIDAGLYYKDAAFVSVSSASTFHLESRQEEYYQSGYSPHGSYYPERYYRDHHSNSLAFHNGRITAFAALGIGRVYSGRFAFSSLSMIKELGRRKLILRNASMRELETLTDSVYYYRLKHGLDKREQRIRALTSISQYLASTGVTIDSSIPVVLAIEDIWDYFPRDDRYFGLRARFGVNFRYRNSSLRNTEKTNDTVHYRAYHPGDSIPYDSGVYIEQGHRYQYDKYSAGDWSLCALFEYHKPLSLHWQCDISASASYSLNDYGKSSHLVVYWLPVESDNSSSKIETDDNQISGEGRIWLTYLVDARTSAAIKFTFLAGIPFSGYFDRGTGYGNPAPGLAERDDWDHSRQDYLILSPSFAKRLAISTTLTLTADFKWDIFRWDTQQLTQFNHRLSYSIGATLSHQIF